MCEHQQVAAVPGFIVLGRQVCLDEFGTAGVRVEVLSTNKARKTISEYFNAVVALPSKVSFHCILQLRPRQRFS